MDYQFPSLPYAYDALEPHIDAMTMEIHYTKHHKTYFDKFVAAIKETDSNGKPLEEIFAHVSKLPMAVRNHGGGYTITRFSGKACRQKVAVNLQANWLKQLIPNMVRSKSLKLNLTMQLPIVSVADGHGFRLKPTKACAYVRAPTRTTR